MDPFTNPADEFGFAEAGLYAPEFAAVKVGGG